ncbi:GntR family transcriptional regulator [Vallitalea maricola]|uniref:GntR family transcriptional regulator n=1 Tax=Vallitalea maricola TaxID=3074433 RepID=A0ACB5UH30_9FIRM|nr:GntR family transcriptional regulator [Vallitalea sp. AN17-2]
MNLVITPKLTNENNREYSYRILRKNIMSLQLIPGENINEHELSNLFSMSRTPIHESLINLKNEYLIDVLPQSGSKISKISIQILKEGLYLRSIIEPDLIKSLMETIHPNQLSILFNILNQQKKVLNAPDNIDSFFKLDDLYHKTIYDISGKPHIWTATKKLCSHFDRVRYLDAIINGTDLSTIFEEHNQIYHYLMIGTSSDFDIHAFYESHLNSFKKRFYDIMKNYPDYFVTD